MHFRLNGCLTKHLADLLPSGDSVSQHFPMFNLKEAESILVSILWKSRVFKLNHTHMQRKSGLLLDLHLLAGKQELPLQTPWIFPCTIKAPSATSNISQEAFVVIFSSCLEHFVCFFVPLQWVQSTHLAVSETGSAVTVWKKKSWNKRCVTLNLLLPVLP